LGVGDFADGLGGAAEPKNREFSGKTIGPTPSTAAVTHFVPGLMRRRCHLVNITPAITIIEWYANWYLHPESNGYIRLGQSINVAEFDCPVVAEKNFISMACLPDAAFAVK
jgi:hypothetical protein